MSDSSRRGSVSSLERESPEPGEASEDEPLHYQHYYPYSYTHRVNIHPCFPTATPMLPLTYRINSTEDVRIHFTYSQILALPPDLQIAPSFQTQSHAE